MSRNSNTPRTSRTRRAIGVLAAAAVLGAGLAFAPSVAPQSSPVLAPASAQAAWWTCSKWITKENGIDVGHLTCAGQPPEDMAKYYQNLTSCRHPEGYYIPRIGLARKIGSGQDSATYCPKGTRIINTSQIHTKLRTRI